MNELDHYQQLLTEGAIDRMLKGVSVEEPVLQMLNYKDTSNETTKRRRLVLSDGLSAVSVFVLEKESFSLFEREQLEQFSICKLLGYELERIEKFQVIRITNLESLVRGSLVRACLSKQLTYNSKRPLLTTVGSSSSEYPSKRRRQNEQSPVPTASAAPMEVAGEPLTVDGIIPQYQSSTSRSTSIRNATTAGHRVSANHQSTSISPISPISRISQISQITTEIGVKWTIKGRCIAKTSIREWRNSKSEGSLFSFDLKDQSGSIRITAFNAQCASFFDIVKVDEIYQLSGGRVKKEDSKFKTMTSSAFEITLDAKSALKACDDDGSCPAITYDFKKISEVAALPVRGCCDVVAIIVSIGSVNIVTNKNTQKELHKRDLIIVDDSNFEITLTIWHETAINLVARVGSVIVGRSLRVSDFNVRSLSTMPGSRIELDPPNLEEAKKLVHWYRQVGQNGGLPVTNRLTIAPTTGGFQAKWRNLSDVTEETVQGNNVVTLQTKATIVRLGKRQFYLACIRCNKKLVALQNDFFRCNKCNYETTDFNHRLLLQFKIADHIKTEVWVQAFHNECLQLLGSGIRIKELYEQSKSNFEQFYDRIEAIRFTSYVFKLRVQRKT